MNWYSRRDPQLASLRRGARAAIVLSGVFAIGDLVLGDKSLGLYAAFGSIALLLFADVGGPRRQRSGSYLALATTGLALLALGTVCSTSVWLAIGTTLLMTGAILFTGVVSSVVAGVTPALLLSFVLGVAVPGGTAALAGRSEGWICGTGASLVALVVLWPLPSRNPLRQLAAAGCLSVADQLDTPDRKQGTDPLDALRSRLYATPVPPGAVGTAGRHLLHLIDALLWLETLTPSPAGDAHVAADLLRRSGSALMGEQPSWPPVEPQTLIEYAAGAIAGEARLVADADRRSTLQRLLGDDGGGEQLGWQVAAARLHAQLDIRSVWLRTSTRGAVALALSVLTAAETGVQHGFWVTFGALSVLRTTAVETGQNVLRALLGTAIGIAVGSVIIEAAGHQHAVLWSVLPLAVLITGVAPAVIGFLATQAAFTVTFLVVFTLVAPTRGIGVVRLEDVALGCGVSLAAGLLLWPRGSSEALNRALAEALRASAGELSAQAEGVSAPTTSDAARGRLDGAFRQLLAESGTPRGSLADLGSAVMAPSALALTAKAFARQPLTTENRTEAAVIADWFCSASNALIEGSLPPPLADTGDPALAGLRRLSEEIRPSLVRLAHRG